MGSLRYQGYTLHYDEHGAGGRPLILVHSVLLNRFMFAQLAPLLAAGGNRVICLDLLGHGESDHPEDLDLYSVSRFARQVVALMNHLGLETAVVGGAGLGANVALELASHDPDRVEALFIEMPVLDNALAWFAAFFTPILLGLRIGGPLLDLVSRAASRLPRTHSLLDSGLDLMRRRPGPSVAVLEGVLLGEVAPHRNERREIAQRALVVGHPRDPMRPFSDSETLVSELAEAQLVEVGALLEWSVRPKRLAEEMVRFLDQVWNEAGVAGGGHTGANGNGRHMHVVAGG
jgi:pimeloyl-ACP methyl ester carboxylesterase